MHASEITANLALARRLCRCQSHADEAERCDRTYNCPPLHLEFPSRTGLAGTAPAAPATKADADGQGLSRNVDQTIAYEYRLECRTSDARCDVNAEQLVRVKYRVAKEGARREAGRINLYRTALTHYASKLPERDIKRVYAEKFRSTDRWTLVPVVGDTIFRWSSDGKWPTCLVRCTTLRFRARIEARSLCE